MTDPARYALYYTPAPGSELACLGAAAVGYDCQSRADIAHPQLAGILPEEVLAMTTDPRRYGFHATLKAPFVLKDDATHVGLMNAVRAFAAEWPPIEVGAVSPRCIGRFIGLTLDRSSSDLMIFAAECVAAIDGFRAPLTEKDRQRRGAGRLTPRQRALLERWGYPYVFDEFRFHMSLTGALPEERQAAWITAITHYIGDPKVLVVDALTLLVQPDPHSRFHVIGRYPLEGRR